MLKEPGASTRSRETRSGIHGPHQPDQPHSPGSPGPLRAAVTICWCVILLLDFVILSCVQFWFWLYIAFVVFAVVTLRRVWAHVHVAFCSVHTCHSVIYLSMQLLFIFDIIFIFCWIVFDLLYSIIIFDICCHYSWDLSLYLYSAYHLIFSIIIHTYLYMTFSLY